MAHDYRRSTAVPGLRLRPIRPGDEDFLCEVFASSRADEFARLPLTGTNKQAMIRQQYEIQHAQYRARFPSASFDLVENADGNGVGRLYVFSGERELRLIEITLLPSQRGRGVGTALVREVQEEARAAGKDCCLEVVAHNPARRLYRRLGFVEETEHPPYVGMRWSATTAD